MAFRGRGRGRGFGGGGGFRIAKQEPFILFPDIENFPDAKTVVEDIPLVVWNSKFQKFWNSSPYYIVDGKATNLSGFIKMSGEYVPAELAKVSDSKRRTKKNVLWNPKSDMHRLDFFEKLEQKEQGQVEKSGKEKKEDENEEEDDENLEEEDEEFSDDGDYNQNIDFDDDEDDFNMDDGNDDEPIY